jgi:hypothetical protein
MEVASESKNMENRPRLLPWQPSVAPAPNVLIVQGFHWHVNEDTVKTLLQRCANSCHGTTASSSGQQRGQNGGSLLAAWATPVTVQTVKLYEDPSSGASRGIAFVELAGEPAQGPAAGAGDHLCALQKLAAQVRQEHPNLSTFLCYLTNQVWDRRGRLPELPWERISAAQALQRGLEGYGSQGYLERAVLATPPNTATVVGSASLLAWRKRMRPDASSSDQDVEDR